jgi:hypothetical protein
MGWPVLPPTGISLVFLNLEGRETSALSARCLAALLDNLRTRAVEADFEEFQDRLTPEQVATLRRIAAPFHGTREKIIMNVDTICPKCKGEMQEGFIVDRANPSPRGVVSSWVAGKAEKPGWEAWISMARHSIPSGVSVAKAVVFWSRMQLSRDMLSGDRGALPSGE